MGWGVSEEYGDRLGGEKEGEEWKVVERGEEKFEDCGLGGRGKIFVNFSSRLRKFMDCM